MYLRGGGSRREGRGRGESEAWGSASRAYDYYESRPARAPGRGRFTDPARPCNTNVGLAEESRGELTAAQLQAQLLTQQQILSKQTEMIQFAAPATLPLPHPPPCRKLAAQMEGGSARPAAFESSGAADYGARASVPIGYATSYASSGRHAS